MRCVLLSLLLLTASAVISFPHVISAVEIQVGELKTKILSLEEDERQLQTALEEKLAENNQLRAVDPESNNLIAKLKNVILMNHFEKEKHLKEARSLLAGLPEMSQSHIIRQLHMERYFKVYPFIVPNIRKEIPINRDDNRFNVTLRLALASGNRYDVTIEKFKTAMNDAINNKDSYIETQEKLIKEWANEITEYSENERCFFDVNDFINQYKNVITQLLKQEAVEAEKVDKNRREMKLNLQRKYTVVSAQLKKMLPNKQYEDEELDVVRYLVNETDIAIQRFGKEITNVESSQQSKQRNLEVQKSVANAVEQSNVLDQSDACKEYRKKLHLPMREVKDKIMKLAFLQKLTEKQIIIEQLTS
ncbi:hypothetical protein EIN_345930 [Entamoeba invadens IP1]|uniref:Uncharacterized protein n=2 Tax=Entamoeba invadens TaxID=33085 RepID=L7FJB7_ENTIV|nr:hypothetical protein EIN_345930 [Entamoeba invadens IP1]ELP84007.1 hypothetical protein EIN_345930 [Entamoeba invadens IP1]BAN41162.1 hypothetical protein [Entamoeba invadens]BAN42242.1 hypothetical protein [Entamoeba invadens]|eukprot:XP_004183353.1 hypothetical protein EIN_345930 [Entamoeba invadens IP1]